MVTHEKGHLVPRDRGDVENVVRAVRALRGRIVGI